MHRLLNATARRVCATFLMLCLTASAALAQDHSRSKLERAEDIAEGRGEFEMVLIHGLGAKAEVWDQVVPFLKNALKVRVFELAGHGSTQPIAEGYPRGAWGPGGCGRHSFAAQRIDGVEIKCLEERDGAYVMGDRVGIGCDCRPEVSTHPFFVRCCTWEVRERTENGFPFRRAFCT